MAYDEFTAKMVRKCSELEQALAEKDREIAKWKQQLKNYQTGCLRIEWTTQKPVKPGWYWFRRPSADGVYIGICRVRQIDIDNPIIALPADTEWSSESIKEPEDV